MDSKVEINFDIKLRKKQQEIYDAIHTDNVRYVIALMSRQIGKSIIAEVLLIEYMLKKKTFNAYISPNYSQGRKVYSEINSLLLPTGLISKSNGSDLKIELTNGSVLKFFSMESPKSIRGYTIDGLLVLDEAAYFPHILPSGEDPYFNIIYPITKARKPKVLIISTPNGKNGFFYELYLKAKNNEKGYKLIEGSIYDDESITIEEINELKKTYPPLAWQQEFEIKFLTDAISVFPDFDNCFTLDSFKKTDKVWCGIDPSTVGEDNTVVTIVNINNDVKQYIIDGGIDEKYDKIAKILNEYNPVATYMEDNSIGLVMYNEIRKKLNAKSKFHTFTTTNNSKKDYIGLIASDIANKDIHFEKTNTTLYQEMGVFTYKLTKVGNITYAAKEGYNDDTITSLGLALQCKNDYKAYNSKNTVFMPSFEKIIR